MDQISRSRPDSCLGLSHVQSETYCGAHSTLRERALPTETKVESRTAQSKSGTSVNFRNSGVQSRTRHQSEDSSVCMPLKSTASEDWRWGQRERGSKRERERERERERQCNGQYRKRRYSADWTWRLYSGNSSGHQPSGLGQIRPGI